MISNFCYRGPESGEAGGTMAEEFGRQLAEARRLGAADVADCGAVYQLCPGSLFDVLDETNLL